MVLYKTGKFLQASVAQIACKFENKKNSQDSSHMHETFDWNLKHGLNDVNTNTGHSPRRGHTFCLVGYLLDRVASCQVSHQFFTESLSLQPYFSAQALLPSAMPKSTQLGRRRSSRQSTCASSLAVANSSGGRPAMVSHVPPSISLPSRGAPHLSQAPVNLPTSISTPHSSQAPVNLSSPVASLTLEQLLGAIRDASPQLGTMLV